MTTPNDKTLRDATYAELVAAVRERGTWPFPMAAAEPVAWGQLGTLNGKSYLRLPYDRTPYPPPADVIRNLNLVPLYAHPASREAQPEPLTLYEAGRTAGLNEALRACSLPGNEIGIASRIRALAATRAADPAPDRAAMAEALRSVLDMVAGGTPNLDTVIAARAALAAAPAQAVQPMTPLTEADLNDLIRLDDLFSDDQGWDLPKERMQRLAELGVIRHTSRGIYTITSFGMHCLGRADWPFPLRTFAEYNASQAAAMRDRAGTPAAGATEPRHE